MKHTKNIAAAALSVLLLSSLTVPALAAAAPPAKEEVIYVMTDAAGKVTDMEAVNIFPGGSITDYGDYSAVKVLNTTDNIHQSGEKITLYSAAERVYYQGTMKSSVIPWNISIRYLLNGVELPAEDIAGKSGALEIRFSVSKNESCTGSFYEDYALQASFTLDTKRCKNILSSGATAANVGSDKQLTYTILPDSGIETAITADVTDFEMDSVAINGVRLELDLDVDDSALTDKIDDVVSAIDELNDGAQELQSGAFELYDATQALCSGACELHSGAISLSSGAGELYSGLSTLATKNSTLTDAAYTAYEGLCTAAAAALNAQLEANGMDTIVLTPSTYSAVLTGLLEKLNADAVYQQAYQAALQQVTAQVEANEDIPDEHKKAYIQQMMASEEVTAKINAAVSAVSTAAKQVSELKGQLDSYGTFYRGLSEYTGAVSSAASGASTLKQGTDTLLSGTAELLSGAGELSDGARELYDGTCELADGTAEFADEASDIDERISDEIDSMTASFTGGGGEVVSFVSDKNGDVASVQFVIKTAAIEKAEVAPADAPAEAPLTPLQKLLRLFGAY